MKKVIYSLFVLFFFFGLDMPFLRILSMEIFIFRLLLTFQNKKGFWYMKQLWNNCETTMIADSLITLRGIPSPISKNVNRHLNQNDYRLKSCFRYLFHFWTNQYLLVQIRFIALFSQLFGLYVICFIGTPWCIF